MKWKLFVALASIIIAYVAYMRLSIHSRFGNAIKDAENTSTRILSDIENKRPSGDISLEDIGGIGISISDCKMTETSVSTGEGITPAKIGLVYKCKSESERVNFRFAYSIPEKGVSRLEDIIVRVGKADIWTIKRKN